MADKPFLVVIDTQRIKSYVFGSRYLREVRGASLLLDRLNRLETRKLLPKDAADSLEEVFLGGGSGLVLFREREAADEFADGVARLYRENTVNAQVSVEVLTRQPGESFPEWVARGVRRSRRNKLGRGGAVPLLGGRWIRPCSSCGREPAQTIRRDVQGTHRLCSACSLKRQEIKRFYQWQPWQHGSSVGAPIPTLATLKDEAPDTVLETLAKAMEARVGEPSHVYLPRDFEEIGKKSKPANYFGFIYADGNQLGKAIRAMAEEFTADEEAKAAYRAFSEIVDLATREAAVEAVLDQVAIERVPTDDGGPGHLVPAEFVMAGGDDLVLVVPAQAALAVAGRFVELFHEKTRQLQERWIDDDRLPRRFAPEGLTTSAGVVLAHASYPASQLLGLAKELMKLAKRRAAKVADTRPTGTLDFMVVHQSGSEGFIERRRREYEDEMVKEKTPYFSDFKPGAPRRIRRTERPYTPEELWKLFERVQALRESTVPRGKLKALYPTLFQGYLQARFDALRILERLQATGDLEKPALAELKDELSYFPFRIASDEWTTPLTEIIEVYDFVPQRPAPEPGEAALG